MTKQKSPPKFEEIIPDDPTPTLPDRVTAIISHIKPRHCGPLIKELTHLLPLRRQYNYTDNTPSDAIPTATTTSTTNDDIDLSHLKRVRRINNNKTTNSSSSSSSPLSKKPRHSTPTLQILLGSPYTLDNLLPPSTLSRLISTYELAPIPQIVPGRPARSTRELSLWNELWPTLHDFRNDVDRRREELALNDEEEEMMRRGMREAIDDAVAARESSSSSSRSFFGGGAVIMCPRTGEIASRAQEERLRQERRWREVAGRGVDDDEDQDPLEKQQKKKQQEKEKNQHQERKKPKKQAFPSPSPHSSQLILRPTFGTHRPSSNAIFALAEGYDLATFVLFVQSLRQTGYDGDVVLSISALDKLPGGVEEYLRGMENVVVYAVDWECYSKNGDRHDGSGQNTVKGGWTDCHIRGMYADEDGTVLPDPQDRRPVATARYELYWAWSLSYDAHSQIMLIDSRDTFFQSNPFVKLTPSTGDEGILRLFGENDEATNIGFSPYNSRWIKQAYGNDALEKIKDKPTICSGSTIGEQIAVEAYLRAMVHQFSSTKCTSVGCDQGFHNYLYYFDKLKGLPGIREIVVAKQGEGIINNLAAMRTKPLKEWGVLKDNGDVVNWDGTLSPVAHQFDRDAELNDFIKKKRRDMVARLKH